MSEHLPSRIRDYVRENQLEEACEVLIGTPLSKRGIAQVARLKELNRLVQTGQISNEEAGRGAAKIRAALLDAADELEKPPSSLSSKRSFLWIGAGLLGVLLLGGLWWFAGGAVSPDCTTQARKYSVFVANFREDGVFANRLYRNLDDNFRRHDSVRIGGLGSYINPSYLNKQDTLSEVEEENCMDKGLIVYGSMKEVEQEEFFDCYIKLVNLEDPAAEIKTENGEVILSYIKTPEQLNFTISDRAKKVCDFTTGLLKYYWGEKEALTYFQEALKDSVLQEEGDFKNTARLYVANTLVKAAQPTQALEIYEEIAKEEPDRPEVVWNIAEVHREMGRPELAVQQFARYVEIKQSSKTKLPKADVAVLLEVTEELIEQKAVAKVEDPLAAIVEVLPNKEKQAVMAKLEAEAEPEPESPEDPDPIEEPVASNTEEQNQQAETREEALLAEDSPSLTDPLPSESGEASNPDLLPVEMIYVKGGTFSMGGKSGYSDAKPVHEVRLSSFFLGKYEVTFEQYEAYCTAIGTSSPSDEGWGKGRRPVINVSWLDAIRYCNWLSQQHGYQPVYEINGSTVTPNWIANGYRLPTEAEWEYAARGGQKMQETTYAGSNEVGEVGWYASNAGSKSHPVGEKAANELLLHDMSGNVREWCWDWYDSKYYESCHQEGIVSNPKGSVNDGTYRVIRGGGWFYNASSLLVSSRDLDDPSLRNGYLGFRLARTAQ